MASARSRKMTTSELVEAIADSIMAINEPHYWHDGAPCHVTREVALERARNMVTWLRMEL